MLRYSLVYIFKLALEAACELLHFDFRASLTNLAKSESSTTNIQATVSSDVTTQLT